MVSLKIWTAQYFAIVCVKLVLTFLWKIFFFLPLKLVFKLSPPESVHPHSYEAIFQFSKLQLKTGHVCMNCIIECHKPLKQVKDHRKMR
jgi:hypothetical protein